VQRVRRVVPARAGRLRARAGARSAAGSRVGADRGRVRVRAAAGSRAVEFSLPGDAAGRAGARAGAGGAGVDRHRAVRGRQPACRRTIADRDHLARRDRRVAAVVAGERCRGSPRIVCGAPRSAGRGGGAMTPALAAVFAVEAMLFAAVGLTALDMRAHARVENLGGVNLWGYRGRVLETKRASEVRIAIAGGALAFGWGVAPTETLAPFLRRLVALEVERSGAGGRVVTAVDAGAMGLAPREYADWLSHLSILNADVICLVLDPPGHVPSAAAFLPDRRSLAFRRFGYSPILPLVLREKAALIGSPATAAAGDLLARVDALFASPAESPAAAPGDAEYLG